MTESHGGKWANLNKMLPGKQVIGVGALLLVVCGVVIGAVRLFGEQKVIAVATALSFIATALAALAAWGYLKETAEVVKATKNSATEQARVARVMEADLRFRIAPNLQFRPQGGSIASRPAEIVNIGRGVAVGATGKVTYLPTNREQILKLDNWFEPQQTVRISIGQQPDEVGFKVEMSCTDSAELNSYTFRQDGDERPTVEVKPIVASSK